MQIRTTLGEWENAESFTVRGERLALVPSDRNGKPDQGLASADIREHRHWLNAYGIDTRPLIPLVECRVVVVEIRQTEDHPGVNAAWLDLTEKLGPLDTIAAKNEPINNSRGISVGTVVRYYFARPESMKLREDTASPNSAAITFRVVGYAFAPNASEGTIIDLPCLPEEWKTFADAAPTEIARRAREAEEARRALSFEIRPPVNGAVRLLADATIVHGPSLLALKSGTIIEEPALIESLRACNIPFGPIETLPPERPPLVGMQVRFISPFYHVAPNGTLKYEAGAIVTADLDWVERVRKHGAQVDLGPGFVTPKRSRSAV